jgi:hypothetical protein
MRDEKKERVLLAALLNQRPCWLLRWGITVFLVLVLLFLVAAHLWGGETLRSLIHAAQ